MSWYWVGDPAPCCYSSSYGYYLTIWCFLCILVERFSSCASFAVCLVICQCAPSVLCFISLSLCHVPMSVSVVQPVGSGFTFRVCVSCLLMLIRISCASCLPFLVVPLCVYLWCEVAFARCRSVCVSCCFSACLCSTFSLSSLPVSPHVPVPFVSSCFQVSQCLTFCVSVWVCMRLVFPV